MSKTNKPVENLIDLIKATRFENVFNPYVHNCEVHDNEQSCQVRESNLRLYLNQQLKLKPEIIWLGRDLGYRGGRRTGIPLTDEIHLPILNQVLGVKKIVKATKTEPMKELTASVVWKLTSRFSVAPFFWNVFPFHPYSHDDAMTNRSHSKIEFQNSQQILDSILSVFGFKYYFALGRDAYAALEGMGIKPIYARHPSHGGQKIFSQTIMRETPPIYATF